MFQNKSTERVNQSSAGGIHLRLSCLAVHQREGPGLMIGEYVIGQAK